MEGVSLQAECILEAKNQYLINISGELKEETAVGDWYMQVRPAFTPDFTYTPHLTPESDNVIDMHVFRTPVMIAMMSISMIAYGEETTLAETTEEDYTYLDDMSINQLKALDAEIHKKPHIKKLPV